MRCLFDVEANDETATATRNPKMSFTYWYVAQFARILSENLFDAHGIPGAEISRLLAGRSIPRSLHDYNLVAGRHWMNSNFERLLPPDQLRQEQQYIVFMDENQNVAHWGYRHEDAASDDPRVYCGSWEGDDLVWYDEGRPLSQFIIDMWLETCTGGE